MDPGKGPTSSLPLPWHRNSLQVKPWFLDACGRREEEKSVLVPFALASKFRALGLGVTHSCQLDKQGFGTHCSQIFSLEVIAP